MCWFAFGTVVDAFFGADSIEAWFLKRLVKACEKGTIPEIYRAAAEFNANVPCPGISPTSDMERVKKALTGLLRTLLELSKLENSSANPKAICTLLQSVYRILPCIHGYKHFVEIQNPGESVWLHFTG